MILQLTTVDGYKVWLNSKFIEAFGPSRSVPNATWIDMASREEYHISESPEEVKEELINDFEILSFAKKASR